MSILLIDFGSQYTHLITRSLNYYGVNVLVRPYTTVDESSINSKLNTGKINGVILSGGPQSVSSVPVDHPFTEWFTVKIEQRKIPVLGICFGMQWLLFYLGGKLVADGTGREFGATPLHVNADPKFSKLLPPFEDINATLTYQAWMSHEDQVLIPAGLDELTVTGWTKDCACAAFECSTKQFYGVQYHPEVSHTEDIIGDDLLCTFIDEICNIDVVHGTCDYISQLKEQVDKELKGNTQDVLVAVSGGVDSTVLASLLSSIIPGRLYCVYVDNGFMRQNETEEICARFKDINARFIPVDARAEFMAAIKGLSDPELKRKAIGKTFIKVFEDLVNSTPALSNIGWLAQGTIYPDIIESSGLSGTAKVIKSHHNVGGLPETLQLKLLEPLKYLFKDQVRECGERLKLSSEFINRHPFPGPGLAIRIVGCVTEARLAETRIADKIFIDALKSTVKHNVPLYNTVSQAYVGFLPVKTVGVVGDNRRHGYTMVLRAVTTVDYMTASAASLPIDFLSSVATKIVSKCHSVARVLYDVTSKPPGTIELE